MKERCLSGLEDDDGGVSCPHPGATQLILSWILPRPRQVESLGVGWAGLSGAWRVGLVDLPCKKGTIGQLHGRLGGRILASKSLTPP